MKLKGKTTLAILSTISASSLMIWKTLQGDVKIACKTLQTQYFFFLLCVGGGRLEVDGDRPIVFSLVDCVCGGCVEFFVSFISIVPLPVGSYSSSCRAISFVLPISLFWSRKKLDGWLNKKVSWKERSMQRENSFKIRYTLYDRLAHLRTDWYWLTG